MISSERENFLLELKREERTGPPKESLITNYYVLSGELETEKLDQTLHTLGFSQTFYRETKSSADLYCLFGSGSQSLALVIFIISFSALTIIQKTLEMRSAEIRYISGMRRLQLLTFLKMIV